MKPTTQGEWMLVREDVLPDIYGKVLRMKSELTENGGSFSISEAARRYGISRSAYYKYKDAVRPYAGQGSVSVMTVRVLLQDCPGVLSGLLSACARAGANVLTVNQQAPVSGCAAVTLCVQTERMTLPPELFAELIGKVPGVQRILDIKRHEQEGGSEA
ncbi:MAG: ACT domain-containing protein [Clostridia bacterium]|nr:ACT domain-containing protein [Clostridia bacterium]